MTTATHRPADVIYPEPDGQWKASGTPGPGVYVTGHWTAPTGSEYWVDARWEVFPDLSTRLTAQHVNKTTTFHAAVPPTHRAKAIAAAQKICDRFLAEHPDDPWLAHQHQRHLDIRALRHDVALARRAVLVLEHHLEQAEGGGEYERYPLGTSAGYTRDALDVIREWREES